MLPSRTVKAKVVTVFLIRWYTIRYNHSRSIIFSQLNLDAIHTLRTTPPVCSGENRMLWHRHRIQFVWIRSHFIFCFLFFFFLCNSILFRCVRKNLFDFGWFYRNINNTFGKSKEIPLMQSFSSVDMIKCACVYRSTVFLLLFSFCFASFFTIETMRDQKVANGRSFLALALFIVFVRFSVAVVDVWVLCVCSPRNIAIGKIQNIYIFLFLFVNSVIDWNEIVSKNICFLFYFS